MKYSISIAVFCLLALEAESRKDGYPVNSGNCKYECWSNDKCADLCKKKGATKGYCYRPNVSCYCQGLPDNQPIKKSGRCNPSGGRRK